jgi:hypothetical protein
VSDISTPNEAYDAPPAEPVVKWPPAFEPYGKTAHWNGECLVTEKIDGSNVFVMIHPDPALPLAVGSRNRWISPGKATDNFGFAAWVAANEEAIRRLGPGRHNGEWWGCGIGRGYGLAERRWSLFNATQWTEEELRTRGLPDNVRVVPILARATVMTDPVGQAVMTLMAGGSVAAPGYMRPEGVIVFLRAAGKLLKLVFDKDAKSPEEK